MFATRIAVLATSVALVAVSSARATPFDYSDSIFLDSDYAISNDHNGALASVTGLQQLTGGNPDEYRAISHNSFTLQIASYHLRDGFIYDTANDPVSAIDFHIDAKALINHAGINIGLCLLLKQGSTNYYSIPFVINNDTLTWQSLSILGLTAADFRTWASISAHPDFTQDMQFGIAAINDNGGANRTRSVAVDNFHVTVNPVPEPATIFLLILAFTGLHRKSCGLQSR